MSAKKYIQARFDDQTNQDQVEQDTSVTTSLTVVQRVLVHYTHRFVSPKQIQNYN